MLEQICAHLHNYFPGDRYAGTFAIEGGTMAVDGLSEGQAFRICGSRMNDGVYTYPPEDLTDEIFNGVVWEMRPPRAFLALVDEISAWQAQYGPAAAAPYRSESFAGYGYRMKDGAASTWQAVFKDRLDTWRRLG